MYCKAIATAVAATAAALTWVSSSFAVEKDDKSLKVGSYNIRCPADKGENAWDNRRADLVKFMNSLDFDVVGLQEVAPAQAAYIKKHLSQYGMVCEFRNADRKSGEASPVCYKKSRFEKLKSGTFWLSETPDGPGSKSWGAAFPRICSWALLRDKKTGRAFCFANAHTDHKSVLARREGMLLVIRKMGEFAPAGTPIVFTGDHNCREDEEPAKAVANILKDSIYATETPPKGAWRTFNGWEWRDKECSAADALKLPSEVRNARKGTEGYKKTGYRIDYVYVSKDVRVKTYDVNANPRRGTKNYYSDHFPVSATIVLPARQSPESR